MPFKLFQFPEKDTLAAKLVDYPVLNSLLRMLLYERLFRIALVGLILLAVSMAMFTLKLWTATPKGFSPRIKLSGLDLMQARSLRRTALNQMANGQFDDAVYSWRVAIANNPVNTELLRGCLTHLLQATDKRKYTPVAVPLSRWLLRLSQTNVADLELSVNLYQRFELDDLTVNTLAPLEKQLTPNLAAVYLKALFNRNQFALFASTWDDAQLRGVQFTDPELALYRAAYTTGWGLLSDAADGSKRLEAAKAEAAQRVLAHRLQLKVSEHLVQPDTFGKSLEFLQDWHQDRLADHISYWQLLAAVGRKSEALQLIGAHVTPPSSGEETVLLAKAYFDLGQKDKAREILQRYAPEYAGSEAVWVSYSNLLMDQQRWGELIEAALLMRHEDNPLRDTLAAYSYFVEGLAELGRGRRPNAGEAFKKIPGTKMKNKIWELIIAEKLASLGFLDTSKEMLHNLDKEMPDDPRVWVVLAKTAFDVQDPDLLVSALASAYKLQPQNPLILNNYAAALLATRQQHEKALELTSRALERAPADPGLLINRCLALLQNERLAEAEPLLGKIDATKLSGADLSSYHFAWFEVYIAQHRYEEAKRASRLVDARHLLPPERARIQSALKQLEPPAVAGRS